jgi:hypothetical protein
VCVCVCVCACVRVCVCVRARAHSESQCARAWDPACVRQRSVAEHGWGDRAGCTQPQRRSERLLQSVRARVWGVRVCVCVCCPSTLSLIDAAVRLWGGGAGRAAVHAPSAAGGGCVGSRTRTGRRGRQLSARADAGAHAHTHAHMHTCTHTCTHTHTHMHTQSAQCAVALPAPHTAHLTRHTHLYHSLYE